MEKIMKNKTKYTPEPWTYRPNLQDDWGFIRSNDGTLVAVANNSSIGFDKYDEFRKTKQDPFKANAARIVECVNACAGITSEQLKRLPEIIDEGTAALDECGRLRYERDELLAACAGIKHPKEFVPAMRKEMQDIRDCIGADQNESTYDEVARLKHIAQELFAALAAAKAKFLRQGVISYQDTLDLKLINEALMKGQKLSIEKGPDHA
jgi:hypothetical protein